MGFRSQCYIRRYMLICCLKPMVEMVKTLKFHKTSHKYAYVGCVDACHVEETVMVTEKIKKKKTSLLDI